MRRQKENMTLTKPAIRRSAERGARQRMPVLRLPFLLELTACGPRACGGEAVEGRRNMD